jgi:SAM-dependent methyltransferase
MISERQTHIEYYREHQIAPVRYDVGDMAAHLRRREALYNRLGLPPAAFRRNRVLEVAAGTGQNSLYVAQLLPAELVLLEPNPTAVNYLHAAYAGFGRPHTAPEVVARTLQEFDPAEPFDVVLCENWLGSSEADMAALDKLAAMVAPGGVLVITTVAPVGFVPNLLRRFLVPALLGGEPRFQAQTQLLERAFRPHLRTVEAMTRSVTDWVQDNMLNPAYFGVCLSIPAALDRLGERFSVLGCSPSFAEDWRWFKAMGGLGQQANQPFLLEYWRKAHNFLDYRLEPFAGDEALNRKLEEAALLLLAAIRTHEDAWLRGEDAAAEHEEVRRRLEAFAMAVPREMHLAAAALQEFLEKGFAVPPGEEGIDAVANMAHFSDIFGRETVYLSILRRTDWASGAAL